MKWSRKHGVVLTNPAGGERAKPARGRLDASEPLKADSQQTIKANKHTQKKDICQAATMKTLAVHVHIVIAVTAVDCGGAVQVG